MRIISHHKNKDFITKKYSKSHLFFWLIRNFFFNPNFPIHSADQESGTKWNIMDTHQYLPKLYETYDDAANNDDVDWIKCR